MGFNLVIKGLVRKDMEGISRSLEQS